MESTTISKGSTVTGCIRTDGNVHVDGTVEGNVETTASVSIGPSGVITGSIHAKFLLVAGRVGGDVVVSDLLKVMADGRLRGQAKYGKVHLEPGALVEHMIGSELRPEPPAPPSRRDRPRAHHRQPRYGPLSDHTHSDCQDRPSPSIDSATPADPAPAAAPSS